MTRDKFKAQAVARGKPKDEIQKVYNSIDAAGEFEDSPKPAASKTTGTTRSFDDEATNYEQAAAPRQSSLPSDAPASEQIAAGGLDATSFVGRAIASSPTFLGALYGSGGDHDYALKEFYKDLGKRHATQGGFGGAVENILRDPATPIMAPVGGVGSKVASTITKEVVPNVVARVAAKVGARSAGGALESVPNAAERQLENVAEGKPIDVKQAAGDVGTGAAMSAGMGTSADILSSGLKKTALQTMKAFLRPGKTDAREGFKAENIFKHGLDATSLEGMASKTANKLKDLNEQLDAIRQSGTGKGVTVDVPGAFFDAMKSLKLGSAESIFDQPKMKAVLENEILPELKRVAPEGDVDIAKAMKIKSVAGNKASEYGAYNRMGDKDAKVPGDVYAAFTKELRDRINAQVKEKNLGDIDGINKQFEEVLPIMQAIVRRNPTLKSNLPVSLQDIGEGAVGAMTAPEGAGAWDKSLRALGLVAAGRILANPKTAGAAYATGKALEKSGPVGTAVRQAVRSNLLEDIPVNDDQDQEQQ
jgi:hypothetical protein